MRILLAFTLTAAVCLAAAPFKVAHKAPLKAKAKAKVIGTEKEFTKYRVEFNGIEGDRRRDGE